MLGAAWLGSMLPDGDLAGARLYRRTRIERRVPLVRVAGWLARMPVRVLVLLPHRGVTHSLFAGAVAAALAGALVSLAAPALANPAGAGMAIGYGAHIAADACTPGGVPLWAPLSTRRRWLLPMRARIRTGSLREYAVTGLVTGLLLTATLLLAS
jgi:membrane-bound metal-dependent hydrolase YbcI (DUF457 family)